MQIHSLKLNTLYTSIQSIILKKELQIKYSYTWMVGGGEELKINLILNRCHHLNPYRWSRLLRLRSECAQSP